MVFCGSGATGAIDKLIRVLALERGQRPVVFVGPYEHHSNELPWRESVADVVTDRRGRRRPRRPRPPRARAAPPRRPAARRSAASPPPRTSRGSSPTSTGSRSRCTATARSRCFDYAAAGPYLPIEMNAAPDLPDGHARVQGRGLPLAAQVPRRPRDAPACSSPSAALLRNRVPTVPGGGTILFVSPTAQSYHPDPEIREEGGTPAIVESIRAGLAFALKEAVGVEEIRRREHDFARRALRSWCGESADRDPRQHRARAAGDRLARPAPPAGPCCTRTSSSPSSATCSASRRAAAASARARTSTAPTRSTTTWSRRMHAEAGEGPPRRQARVHPAELPVLHQRGGVRLRPRRRSPARRRGLEAAAALPLRPGQRPVGAPRRAPSGAAGDLAACPRRAAARRFARAPESVLAGQLEAARRSSRGAAPARRRARSTTRRCSPEFERIRWFPLPGEGLARLPGAAA